MPGSKCKMPSELNGLHIRHEFGGKAEIACSCGGPSWLVAQRNKYMLALSEGQPAFVCMLGRGVKKAEGDRGGYTLLKGETRSACFCVCTCSLVGGSEINL